MADPGREERVGRAGILHREVIPDPQGLVGFGFLALLVAAHLIAVPDREGRLFGNVLALLPEALRGPWLDICLDGLCQAVLLLGPPVSVYAALRHLTREGDSLIPFFTLAGGGILTVLTGAAMLYALGTGVGLF